MRKESWITIEREYGGYSGRLRWDPFVVDSIIYSVCGKFRLPVPSLEIKKRDFFRSKGLYYGWKNDRKGHIVIRDTDGYNTLIHELAHHLDEYRIRSGQQVNCHGEGFRKSLTDIYNHLIPNK